MITVLLVLMGLSCVNIRLLTANINISRPKTLVLLRSSDRYGFIHHSFLYDFMLCCATDDLGSCVIRRKTEEPSNVAANFYILYSLKGCCRHYEEN